MAETKRVSDQYKISAPTIVIDGNLQVLGSTTQVQSTNSTLRDNIIFLNSGETGAGVSTLGTTAGISIDRGTLPSVTLRWNEGTSTWQVTTDGSTYVDLITGSAGVVAAAGNDTYVQYNGSGYLGAEAAFTYNYTTNYLTVSNVKVGNGSITNATTNANLTISGNGTGTLNLTSVSALSYQGSTPSSTASINKVYAATPASGGSGLWFVNTSDSDELISRKKAVMMALIM